MYESYFGFSRRPFQLTPDPDFFFGSEGHRRAMAFLEYGLQQKEGFIVITGEVGAGKTTLIRSLMRQVVQRNIVPAQVVSTQVGADDLLRLVAQSFGISPGGSDKADTLGQLEMRLRGLHAEGRRALLIVDEAQNLSPKAVEELRMLSNFQIGTDALLQSFLVGQPELRLIMQRPEMRQLIQRVIASYHLGPLNAIESRLYIEHRLRHVGWTGMPHIDQAVYGKVHDFTGGIPRKINTVFDRLLLDCFLAGRQAIGPDAVESVTAEISEELGSPAGRPHTAVEQSEDVLNHQALASTPGNGAADPVFLARCDMLEAKLKKIEVDLDAQRLATNLILKLLDASVTSDPTPDNASSP